MKEQKGSYDRDVNITRGMLKPLFRKRSPYSRKGDSGRIVVIGGSIDYSGAPYFAAAVSLSALRMGADLVTVVCPEKTGDAINSICPDIIVRKIKGDFLCMDDFSLMKDALDRADVIVLGMGMGKRPGTRRLVDNVIARYKDKYKVIDADALSFVDIRKIEHSIFTPHKKEFEILKKNSGVEDKGIEGIKKILGSNVVLLKGHEDMIITPDAVMSNSTGHPGMTVGGTGDLLAGLCAGIIAINKDHCDDGSSSSSSFSSSLSQPFSHDSPCRSSLMAISASAASYVLGKAGSELSKSYGYGYISSDFIGVLARIVKKEFFQGKNI